MKKKLWAYAYQIVPPQSLRQLRHVHALLAHETVAARDDGRSWSGRIVREPAITHILVVTDTPGRHHAINLRLETELERIGASYSVTDALEVADEADGNGRPVPLTGEA